MNRRTIKITVEYEGTAYRGWQRQASDPSIQEALEAALSELTGEEIRVVGAGRTDAGVHAAGQVASFRTSSALPVSAVVHGTNARLPDDIVILRASETAPSFHAQRDARGKHYRYTILNRAVPTALDRRFSYRVSRRLHVDRMAAAARFLEGEHDFSSFRNAGSVEGSPTRTIRSLEVAREGDRIFIDVKGDGFLYRMVRNIVGTLLLVGVGRIEPEEMMRILRYRSRSRAGPAAPAKGLCLVEVYYGPVGG